MVILYDFFCFIFCLLYFPYLVLRGKWHGQLLVRLGRIPSSVLEQTSFGKSIWVHAVSVGEVMVVKKLIEKLRQSYPHNPVILTTVTQTAYGLAQAHLRDSVIILYAPLDFSFSVRRFLQVINPQIYLTAETEIWPNLWTALGQAGVPIVVVNGRISDKSFGGYKKIKSLLRNVLSHVRVFCMQSHTDARRIQELGATESQVCVSGNMKFDDLPADLKIPGAHSGRLGFKESQRIWIAGSTHPGEEDIVLDVFRGLKGTHPDLGLVIAPRHPERKDEIVSMIKAKGFSSVLFSTVERNPKSHDRVVVVDTIGHLKDIYSISDVVFVGKSLAVGGGHNVIEPAFFAKPILVGPLMNNFRDILRLFLDQKAIVQVKDGGDLARRLGDLLDRPDEMKRLGRAAREVVNSNRGATDRTLSFITRVLSETPQHVGPFNAPAEDR